MPSLNAQITTLTNSVANLNARILAITPNNLIYAALGDFIKYGCLVTEGSASPLDMTVRLQGEAPGDAASFLNPDVSPTPTRPFQYPNISSVKGGAFFSNDTTATVATAPAAGTSRYDIAYIFAGKEGAGFAIQTGTPSAGVKADFIANGLQVTEYNTNSPNFDPALPVGAQVVARIYVAESVTSISDAVIADLRAFEEFSDALTEAFESPPILGNVVPNVVNATTLNVSLNASITGSLTATGLTSTQPSTGNPATLASAGVDTDVNLQITAKGAGCVDFVSRLAGSFTASVEDFSVEEWTLDAAGFNTSQVTDVSVITGAIPANTTLGIHRINIDKSLADADSFVTGYIVSSTNGASTAYHSVSNLNVSPIGHVTGGDFALTTGLVDGVDELTDLNDNGTPTNLFVADDDTVTVGFTSTFSQIEVLLDTVASGAGIGPTFEYSTGVGTWATLVLSDDGTNGMRNTGTITWVTAAVAGWATGTGGDYLVRITRTRNTLGTTPIADQLILNSIVFYEWDSEGNLDVNGITTRSNINISNDTPILDMFDTNADTDYAITRQLIEDGNYKLQTRTAADVFVSTDYQISKNASGASQHAWNIAGSVKLLLSSSVLQASVNITVSNAAGAQLQNEAATATNPTILPNKSDTDTGIGWVSSDVVSIVAGGADIARISATNFLVKKSLTARGGNGISFLVGSDGSDPTTITDNTQKVARLAVPHYDTAQAPMSLMLGASNTGSSNLAIGGGTSVANAATHITTYAAADTTTVTGTEITEVTIGGLQVITGDLTIGNGTGYRVGGIDDTYIGELTNVSGVLTIQSDTGRHVQIGGASFPIALHINGTSGTITHYANIVADNAAGPSIRNEAASGTNPTLVPNRTDNDTGIGWPSSGQVAIITDGSQRARFTSSGMYMGNVSGASVMNEVASATNPTLVPHQGDLDTGIGWGGSNVINFVVGGSTAALVSSNGLRVTNAAGPRIINEAATATNPTLVPNWSDDDTGVGWNSADQLAIVAGGATVQTYTVSSITSYKSQQSFIAAGPFLAWAETATATNPTLMPNKQDLDTGIGWHSADRLSIVVGGASIFTVTGTGIVSGLSTGAQISNVTATSTVPTLIANRTETDTGIGWVSDSIVFVVGGVDAGRVNADMLYLQTGDGPALMNDAATATVPTLVPSRSDTNTGIGWSSANSMMLIAGGNSIMRIDSAQTIAFKQIVAENAAGPAFMNEAATTSNPTLIPNRADLTTGIGWDTNRLHIVTLGVSRGFFDTDQWNFSAALKANTSNGPAILNETASDTNPTVCPNKQDLDTGIGWLSADVLSIVAGGVSVAIVTTTGIYAGNAAGAAFQNEAATATNPTLCPNRSDTDTGIGWDSSNVGTLVAAGTKIAQWNNAEFRVNNKVQLLGGAGIALEIGSDNGDSTQITDATDKYARIAVPHYTNAEEPMAIMFANSRSGENELNIGGGTASMNATTKVYVYSAADRTTTGGSIITSTDINGLEIVTGSLTISAGTYSQNVSGRGIKLTHSVGNDSGILDTYADQDLELRRNNIRVAHFNSSKDLLLSGGMYVNVGDGIYLGGTTSANLLDDYEEGTFTPVLSDGTNEATHSVQVGKYTKVGNKVSFTISITTTSLGSVSGALRITGMPFTISADTGDGGGAYATNAGGLSITSGYSIFGRCISGEGILRLVIWDGTTGHSNMLSGEWTADGSVFLTGEYYTDA